MQRDPGMRQIVAAVVAAIVSFCVVGIGLFYVTTDVSRLGWRFSGPAALTGEMAGLFGGGLVAVAVLIAGLRWGRRRSG